MKGKCFKCFYCAHYFKIQSFSVTALSVKCQTNGFGFFWVGGGGGGGVKSCRLKLKFTF